MKITFIVSSFQQSGPGNVVKTLANQLLKMGHQVQIIALSNDFPVYSGLQPTIVIETLNFDHKKISTLMIQKVQSKIRKFQPDIIHSHGLRADKINTQLTQTRVVRVSTSHNEPFRDYPADYHLKGWLMALYQIIQFRRLDGVATLTPEMDEQFNRLLRVHQTQLIPNGVETVPTAQTHHGMAQKKRSVCRLGVVANLIPRKRINQIIEAFQSVSTLNLSLEIFGEGALLTKLQDQSNECVNIHFHGFEHEITQIFSDIDVFISMSKAEGLPLTVLEAISANKPVILSDISPHRYICSQLPAGSFRLISSTSELSKTINALSEGKLIFNDYKDSFFKKFSDRVMARRYVIWYQKLLKHDERV